MSHRIVSRLRRCQGSGRNTVDRPQRVKYRSRQWPKIHDAVAAKAVAEGLVGAEARIFLNGLLGIPQPPELAVIYDTMDNTTRNDGKRLMVVGLIQATVAKRPVVIVVED